MKYAFWMNLHIDLTIVSFCCIDNHQLGEEDFFEMWKIYISVSNNFNLNSYSNLNVCQTDHVHQQQKRYTHLPRYDIK